MSDPDSFKKFVIPWHFWLLDSLVVLWWVGMVVAVFVLYQIGHSPLWPVSILALLTAAFSASSVLQLIVHIKATRFGVDNTGFIRPIGAGRDTLKWEDIVRFEKPSRSRFVLFANNGEKFRVPAQIRDFTAIEAFSLRKLEAIGTFEDGRKMPRVIASFTWGKK